MPYAIFRAFFAEMPLTYASFFRRHAIDKASYAAYAVLRQPITTPHFSRHARLLFFVVATPYAERHYRHTPLIAAIFRH